MKLVRAIVRPIVTLIMVGTVVFMLLCQMPIPEWFIALSCSTIGWWFASREAGKRNDVSS